MSKSTLPSRRLAPFVFALVLALPPPAVAFPAFEPGALIARLERLLSAIWAENGCDADPSGRCASTPRVNACSFDPNGACDSIPRENDCGLETNGRCKD